jgi:hypothetical protein
MPMHGAITQVEMGVYATNQGYIPSPQIRSKITIGEKIIPM